MKFLLANAAQHEGSVSTAVNVVLWSLKSDAAYNLPTVHAVCRPVTCLVAVLTYIVDPPGCSFIGALTALYPRPKSK